MKNYWQSVCIFTLVLFIHVQMPGQQSTLIFIDFIEKEPLPYVRVSFSSDSVAYQAQTDAEGRLFYDGPYPVRIQTAPLGYTSQSVTLNQPSSKTIALEPLNSELDRVVLTGQFANGSSRNSMYKINVLDRKRIEAMGANNLKDLLGQQLNFRLVQDQVLGSQVAIQGISGERVKIMIDGVPVIGRLGGNIDLSQINLDDVERVEIVEGPLSVQYGTDALAGTINLITRKDRPNRMGLQARSYFESVGQYNFGGQARWTQRRNTLSIGGGRNFFGGYSPVDTSRDKNWKPKEQYQSQIQWVRNHTKGVLTLRSQAFHELLTNRGPLREPYRETAFDELYRTLRWDNNLNWEVALNKQWHSQIVAGANFFRREKEAFLKDLTTLTSIPGSDSQQDTTVFERYMWRQSFNRGRQEDTWTSSLGLDASLENGSGGRIVQGGKQIGDFAAFGLLRYRLSKDWKFQAGGRMTYNTAFGTAFTPSLNIWYQLHKQHTFRGSYAQGFRTPSLKELHLYFVDINHNVQGNPDLQPETAHNISLSYDGQLVKENAIFKWEASAWINLLRDVITLAQASPQGDLFTYFNLGAAQSMGIRTGLSWIRENWRLQVGGSLSSFASRLDATSESLPVAWSPETNSLLSYRLPIWGLEASLFHKFNGKGIQFRSDTEGNISQTTTGAYQLFDFNLSRKFWRGQIGGTLGVKNLLDVTDIPVGGGTGGVHGGGLGSVPIGWGRSFFVQIQMNIQ